MFCECHQSVIPYNELSSINFHQVPKVRARSNELSPCYEFCISLCGSFSTSRSKCTSPLDPSLWKSSLAELNWRQGTHRTPVFLFMCAGCVSSCKCSSLALSIYIVCYCGDCGNAKEQYLHMAQSEGHYNNQHSGQI